jgi:cyanate permease
VSCIAYLFIYNYPDTASFLSKKERDFVQHRLKTDSDATDHEKLDWTNVKKAFTDIKCYLYAFGFHSLSLPLYTLSLFLPSIIKGLGFSNAKAQLMTIPPYAIAFCLTILAAVLSERYHFRTPFILGSSSLAILGYILLLSDPRPGVSYVGIIFAAAGIYPSVALTLAWPANNVSGQTKRAIGIFSSEFVPKI